VGERTWYSRVTLANAMRAAQVEANRTGSSVLVYRASHNPERAHDYRIAFTLPTFGESFERIYPYPYGGMPNDK
jgi:hypothetical protein